MSADTHPGRPEYTVTSPRPPRRPRLWDRARQHLRVFARPALAVAPGSLAVLCAATQLPHGRQSLTSPGFVLCCIAALVFAGRNLVMATQESLREAPLWPEAALEGFLSIALTCFGMAGLLLPVGGQAHPELIRLLLCAKWSAVASNMAVAVILAREIVRRPVRA
jgi:hypothetical protein